MIEMKRYYIGLFLLFSVASIHATEIGERDSIGFNVLFNRSMFQSNSPDSLIREKHKKHSFIVWGMCLPSFSGNLMLLTVPI